MRIGEEVEIRIISIRKNKVTLGLVAPRDVKIETGKLSEMEMANTMAAAHSLQFGRLFGAPREGAEKIVFVLEDGNLFGKNLEVADKRNGSSDE